MADNVKQLVKFQRNSLLKNIRPCFDSYGI